MRAFLFIVGDLWIYMSLWFLISIFAKRIDLADIAWGLGFILVAWISYFFGLPPSPVLIINILVSLWGLRLATHIAVRNSQKPEDSRYALWRKDWGKWFPLRAYFQIFILQGVLLLTISLPIIFANFSKSISYSPLFFLGIIVWVIGFVFESVADFQLHKFKSDKANRGQIMQSGVWSLSRHPNYFGEITVWWGIYLMLLPQGWFTIVGPLTITFLILGVSGIPILEKRYEDNKAYSQYQKRVSAFIPRPPRKL